MSSMIGVNDFISTGPETLAGKFLRRFWQPVYCAHELLPGRAVPIRVMGETFTLYRGDSGTPHLVGDRCAHRGTQLSVGWVEGDSIRCFYHGWKYDGSGQCVEQPAEPKSFAGNVRIPGFPVREYLGLIFAYFGEGEPPPFNRFPKFEDPQIVVDAIRFDRICNYYNNIENSLDNTHVRFVHRRHRESVRDYAVTGDPVISVEESDWGVRRYSRYPDGTEILFFFGMPNINYINGQVVDPEVKRVDSLIFKVPVDDDRHLHFEARMMPFCGEQGRQWLERRRAQRAREAVDRIDLVRAVLDGRLRLDDIDPNRTDHVLIEDEVAQTGQGAIVNRSREHLGRGDIGIVLLRKLWERELRALAEGRPLKQWTYRPDMLPIYPSG
jgi:5,5'-dehydrodivanillate O-demethylase oxygenase subunit